MRLIIAKIGDNKTISYATDELIRLIKAMDKNLRLDVRTYDEKNTYLVFGTFNEKEGFHMYACNEEMDAPKEVVPYASLIKEYGINSGTLKYAEYKNDQIKIVVQDGEIFRNVEPGEISVLQAKVDTIKKQCNLVVENKQKKLK